MSSLSVFYNQLLEITPVALPQSGRDTDWLTTLFCAIIVLLTLIIVNGRRKFSYIVRALFSSRSRSQLMRESKPLEEWIYAFILLYVFMVQGVLITFLIDTYAHPITEHFAPFLLYLTCTAAVAADYFLKRFNLRILTTIFECSDDRTTFLENRFFHQICSSLPLLPIVMIATYTNSPAWLFAFIPIFITTYILMIYKTLRLKSSSLTFLQFFLYFCTLEILPILVITKLLLTIN